MVAEEEQDGRFRRQMDILTQLDHPGIVPILETGVTPHKHPYAITAIASGQTLAEKLAAEPITSPIEALQTARQITEILAALHPTGIIHQDLRPENILLSEDGALKLLNLGLPGDQRPIDPAAAHLDYAAPEQITGQPPTAQSNYFSLGVILYEMLAGQTPPLPQSVWEISEEHRLRAPIPLEEIRPGLTEPTYEVVKVCLFFQEWSRYDSAEELLTAVTTAIAAEEYAAAHPPNWLTKIGRRRFIIILLAALVIIALIIGGVLFFLP